MRGDVPSEFKCGGAADSRRSTGDNGDATALESGVPSGIEGGEILCKYGIAAAVARKRTRSGRLIVGRGKGWGRLCWVPAGPSRPLCRSALLGAAKRDGSGP